MDVYRDRVVRARAVILDILKSETPYAALLLDNGGVSEGRSGNVEYVDISLRRKFPETRLMWSVTLPYEFLGRADDETLVDHILQEIRRAEATGQLELSPGTKAQYALEAALARLVGQPGLPKLITTDPLPSTTDEEVEMVALRTSDASLSLSAELIKTASLLELTGRVEEWLKRRAEKNGEEQEL